MNYNKRVVFFAFLFLFILPASKAYTIVGDTVSYTNAYGQLNVTPHTSKGFMEHTQTLMLTSFLAGTQSLDFAFQFNDSVEGNIWVWNGDDWNDITHLISHSVIYKDHKPQHYYWIKNVDFEQDETKTVKLQYRRPAATAGKWDLWVKRSSDNISEALESGYFVHLDPWYNSSLTSRYEINITNSNNTYSLKNYVANITIDTATLISAGNMSAICYARIVDINNVSYSYDIEECNDAATVYWTLIGDLPRDRNTNLWFYFGDVADTSIEVPATVWAGYDLRVPFNDSNVGYDDSPNGWDYALQNSPSLVAGRFGNALDFEEDDSEYMKDTDGDIPVAGKFNVVTDFWFKPDEAMSAAGGACVPQAGDGGAWWQPNYDINNDGGWFLRVDGGTTADLAVDIEHASGTWFHLTFWVNTTHRKIYYNGWELATAATALSGSGLNFNSNGNWIGVDKDTTATRYCDGIFDELRYTDGDTSIFINSSHSWVIPDEQIGITIYGLESQAASSPSIAHYLNISVFNELEPESQIEYYNITIYSAGSKVWNQTGTNLTQINLNQSSIPTGLLRVVVDRAGYYQREQLITSDKATGFNLTFYLLDTSKAVNVGYQVVDITARPISDATITIEKSISGNYSIISEYLTDSSGFISVYLNADTNYQITTTKTSYSTDVRTSRPVSGNSYLIVLNKTIDVGVDSIGLTFRYWFYPQMPRLSTCDEADFSFNVQDMNGNITYFGLNLTLNGSIEIDFIDNNTANLSSGKLNRTLNLSSYYGNITLYGNVTISDYGTVTFTAFYVVDNACNMGYTLDDLFRAFAAGSTGISGDMAAIFLIFLSTFLATSVAGLIGGNGAGVVVYLFEIILPIYGFISWPLYIFIGLGLFAVLLLRNRL